MQCQDNAEERSMQNQEYIDMLKAEGTPYVDIYDNDRQQAPLGERNTAISKTVGAEGGTLIFDYSVPASMLYAETFTLTEEDNNSCIWSRQHSRFLKGNDSPMNDLWVFVPRQWTSDGMTAIAQNAYKLEVQILENTSALPRHYYIITGWGYATEISETGKDVSFTPTRWNKIYSELLYANGIYIQQAGSGGETVDCFAKLCESGPFYATEPVAFNERQQLFYSY